MYFCEIFYNFLFLSETTGLNFLIFVSIRANKASEQTFFVCLEKSATTKNHRTELTDKSYLSSFSRDSNNIKKVLKSSHVVEKNRFENFDFSSYFE